jgi:hypothetical protein
MHCPEHKHQHRARPGVDDAVDAAHNIRLGHCDLGTAVDTCSGQFEVFAIHISNVDIADKLLGTATPYARSAGFRAGP